MSKKKVLKKVARGPSTAAGSLVSASPMDVGLLAEIVKLMTANDLNTVDVREGEKRVILKRGAVQPNYLSPAPGFSHPGPAPAGSSAAGSPAQANPPAIQTPAAEPDANLVPIKSPMVGTFYATPSPDSKPFVSVGSVVNEDTEVCTIEAMKNFLPIKAETRGTIAKILVTSGQTVEYGQALFLVKP